ncbi:glycosyltransferase [Vreelandella lionensis]|uniref:protein O-GlcNAc transferase n=1 Tax=Vreelandella lionensis TaxID=1144478 RepID=A0ABW8BWW0_9GAMM
MCASPLSEKNANRLTKMLSKKNFQKVLETVSNLELAHTESANLFKIKGTALLEIGKIKEAISALEKSHSLESEDAEVLYNLGVAYYRDGNVAAGIKEIDKALSKRPKDTKALCAISKMLIDGGYFKKALEYLEKADKLGNMENSVWVLQADALSKSTKLSSALEVYKKIAQKYPNDVGSLSNLGNIYRMLGQFDKADIIFARLIEKDPKRSSSFSSYFFSKHYNPKYNAESFFDDARNWDLQYAPKKAERKKAKSTDPRRRLRIGMLSSGLRIHPVGNMITSALEYLPESQFELIAYSLSHINDKRAQRLRKRFDEWNAVIHLSDEDLAERIRQDDIDILFDLCGHSEGHRLLAVAEEPAPLIIKWVGGLINTTGPSAIDYLISDSVETPEGIDNLYIEKLIRMPDDYICYLPAENNPPVRALPAQKNGYITLGCFNNPSKLNAQIIAHWAEIMHQLPGSKLFLKGSQYEGEEFIEQTQNQFAVHGIAPDRLIMEAFSPHFFLLDAYNRVDIALDPWPYSGGLTTCEALLMGVPVVTMPGPTFAGRHSATHLVNAGFPELVTESWEQYCQQVLELAGDLESLAAIRKGLRKQLLASPVCDAPRFAKHFTIAMRAIWQRYCEGKAPAALTFQKNGQAQFDGEAAPVQVDVPEIFSKSSISAEPQQPAQVFNRKFNWQLPSKIIVIDNSAKLISQAGIASLRQLKALGIIAFDPTSKVENIKQFEGSEDVQVFPHALLGNGQQTTLYACLDPIFSSTLEPLPLEEQHGDNPQGAKVLAKLPINTIALDSIEGLESLDWLILDDRHDAISILKYGEQALQETLLIQVRIAFQPTHEHQPNFAEIQHWMGRLGFRFYRFNNMAFQSHFPGSVSEEQRQATELTAADAIFLPSHKRLTALSDNQKLKLAFLLHTVYGVKDMAYALLTQVSEEKADEYLVEEGLAEKMKKPAVKREVIYDPSQLECNQREFTLCVGVPVYNEEKYIRETIQSLKKQDCNDVKFLISDNCSTDKTLSIICEEIADDERFEVFQHDKNKGSIENWKFCLDVSRSKYFMWLGGHDFLSDRYLSVVVGKIQSCPSVSMVIGKPMVVDEKSNVHGVAEQAVYYFIDKAKESRYLKSVMELGNCTILNSIFRRSDLSSYFFEKVKSFDHVLISHLLWYGCNLTVDEVSYFRRYFSVRSESYDTRLIGENVELEREEFYQYYLKDFEGLMKEEDEEKKVKMLEMAENILRNRFG